MFGYLMPEMIKKNGSLLPAEGTWLMALAMKAVDIAAVNSAAQASLVALQWSRCLQAVLPVVFRWFLEDSNQS